MYVSNFEVMLSHPPTISTPYLSLSPFALCVPPSRTTLVLGGEQESRTMSMLQALLRQQNSDQRAIALETRQLAQQVSAHPSFSSLPSLSLTRSTHTHFPHKALSQQRMYTLRHLTRFFA